MSYIRYFLLSGVLPSLALLMVGVYIQPVSGDLTRIGNLPERDFGWNAPQPRISVHSSRDNEKSDIVVIGDSFSEKNVWQSVLAGKTGASVRTVHWKHVDRMPQCLVSMVERIVSENPDTRHLLIETVERAFVRRFSHEQATECEPSRVPGIDVAASRTSSERMTGFREALPDPKYAFSAIVQQYRHYASERTGEVTVAPLARTGLFSNRRSDLLLYFNGDREKLAWTPVAVEKSVHTMQQIKKRVEDKGVALTLLVIPDKSSVYSRHLANPDLAPSAPINVWEALRTGGVPSPDLLAQFSQLSERVQDLYLPNDSHLSPSGYQILSQLVWYGIGHWHRDAASEFAESPQAVNRRATASGLLGK